MINNELTPSATTVFILSAGHGKRMMPLTRNTPKPLLKIGDHTLIEHHLIRLKAQGFHHIVINIAYLGKQIREKLGDGSHFGLSITYSDEADTGALETAGGIKAALHLIRSNTFIVINADIWTDFNFASLLTPLEKPVRLVMINNPTHNPLGDFGLSEAGLLTNQNTNKFTFSGIGLYKKSLFENLKSGKQALAPIFRSLINENNIEGIKFDGQWHDIGTPERLDEINRLHKAKS